LISKNFEAQQTLTTRTAKAALRIGGYTKAKQFDHNKGGIVSAASLITCWLFMVEEPRLDEIQSAINQQEALRLWPSAQFVEWLRVEAKRGILQLFR
jgi:hypothetical protein